MVIKRVKGDTFDLSVSFTNENGVPIDITGATVFFTVKRNLEDTDAQALINKTVTSHTAPTQGTTSVTFNASDVDYVGEFFYDFKIKDLSNKIVSIFSNKFILVQNVTRRTS
jgi:hypothetical protein